VGKVGRSSIGEDERFTLQAKDTSAGQVGDHEALHALARVNQSERNLIAATDHAMAHALLFQHLLEFTCIGIA
jgi:tryptophan synthase beta subunit